MTSTGVAESGASGASGRVDDGNVLKWVADHVAWVTAGGALVLGALKIQRVARLDSATAFGLITASGPVDVAVGLFATSLAALASLALVLAAFALNARARSGGSIAVPLAGLSIAIVALAQLASVVPFVLMVAGALLLTTGPARSGETARDDPGTVEPEDEGDEPPFASERISTVLGKRLPRNVRANLLIGIGFVLIVWGATLILDDSVWLVPERLTLTGGRAFTGYVVSVNGRWATLLTEEERRLMIVDEEDLDARQPCSLGDDPDPSLAAVLQGRSGSPDYPRCPSP